MIGDPDYRGDGIGLSAMSAAILYCQQQLKAKTIYSHHLTNNLAITKTNADLGFEPDGKPYLDKSGLRWQNIKLAIAK